MNQFQKFDTIQAWIQKVKKNSNYPCKMLNFFKFTATLRWGKPKINGVIVRMINKNFKIAKMRFYQTILVAFSVDYLVVDALIYD